jgi:hypothetical protein
LFTIGDMLHDFIVSLYGETGYEVLAILLYFYPLWLPPLLGVLFWETWMRYIRYQFFTNTKVVVLEVRLPKEIMKSPAAMEIALNGFYITGGEGTFVARYWNGQTRPWFSLEIVSIGGEIKFLLWTRENVRNIVEAHLYSQFPNIEIRQIEDYARNLVYEPGRNEMWSVNYSLSRPDPLPIKTYIDYGLDKDPKEENENNPLATLLEFMGSIKPTENIFLQFVIRAHKKEKRWGFFSETGDWYKQVNELRTKLILSFQAEGRATLTAEESKILEALSRQIQKFPFDVGIRVVYMAESPIFNNTTITGLRGLLRPFSHATGDDLAGLKIAPLPDLRDLQDKDNLRNPINSGKRRFYAAFNGFKFSGTDDDYPWQDFLKLRMQYKKRRFLDAYKRRMFFYQPYREETNVMTTEALATMWHFPGSAAAAPGLQRIESKRGQAPANLPV